MIHRCRPLKRLSAPDELDSTECGDEFYFSFQMGMYVMVQ